MRSSAFCQPPASSGLVQSFPPAAFALGFLRSWCVCLIVGNEIPCHVSFGVVCGQRTVAACCEMKVGLEWGSLMNSGSRCTRNAVAPPFGTLDSEARISGPKSSHESGTVCPVPHCEVQGTRSRFWAGNWAQNPVLKIRPSGGPAGWDKVCAPGVIRTPCQARFVCVSCARPRWCGPCANGHPSPVRMEQLKP